MVFEFYHTVSFPATSLAGGPLSLSHTTQHTPLAQRIVTPKASCWLGWLAGSRAAWLGWDPPKRRRRASVSSKW